MLKALATAATVVLAAQAPAAVTANGNLDPGEFLAVPVDAIRDSAGDSRLDRLMPERGFRAAAEAAPSGGLRLRWPAVPGKRYRVAYKNSLTDAAWLTDLPGSLVTAPASGGGNELEFLDATPGLAQRFYRIEVQP